MYLDVASILGETGRIQSINVKFGTASIVPIAKFPNGSRRQMMIHNILEFWKSPGENGASNFPRGQRNAGKSRFPGISKIHSFFIFLFLCIR